MDQSKAPTPTIEDEGRDVAVDGGEARLAALEGRVAALEAQLAAGKIKQRKAPGPGSDADRRAAKRARREAREQSSAPAPDTPTESDPAASEAVAPAAKTRGAAKPG